MPQKKIGPVISVFLEDLHIEAVLDKGFWESPGGDSTIHSHSYFELMLCTGSGFSLELATGDPLPMTSDTVCLIPPGLFHRVLGNDQKLAIRFLCTPTASEGHLYPAFLSATAQQAHVLPLGKQPQILALTRLLCKELRSGELGKDAYVQSLLSQLFVLLLRLLCKSDPSPQVLPGTSQSTAMRRLTIEEFFFRNYSKPVTEADLAAQLHLSKRQLSRVLQQLYGMSFRQMLVDIRLHHAGRLLLDTQMSTEQVAAAVGYSSLSGFYDAFRKKFGVTAGGYKKNPENSENRT